MPVPRFSARVHRLLRRNRQQFLHAFERVVLDDGAHQHVAQQYVACRHTERRALIGPARRTRTHRSPAHEGTARVGRSAAGISLEKDDAGDDSDVTVSSKDSRCAKLVAYTNADNPPGSKASAGQSYSGGAQGPFVDETIDAMGSPAAALALQKAFKQAVTACRTMTLKVPGEGSSPISVREVSAPAVGTQPVAVRFTATAGALQGFEVTMVTVAVNDVVVAVTVINGLPEDIEGATTAAVEKAQATLGSAGSGT